MYESFFGLEHPPFQISPDPEFLYPSRVHEEALEHIRFSLNHFKGICLVTGPVGSGKTTICRKILRELNPAGVSHALILNPRLEENELLKNILSDLGAPVQSHEGAAQKLQELILERHKAGRHVVIIVDEAHVMPTESLEVLRLLTNLETTERKLVQVVLFAQPEMEERRFLFTVGWHLCAIRRWWPISIIDSKLRGLLMKFVFPCLRGGRFIDGRREFHG
ncbi:MAG: AAA family ATPase [Actinobacteria bacterium]|nr:AAA family ATPase [Actinomycetota bacterium]